MANLTTYLKIKGSVSFVGKGEKSVQFCAISYYNANIR